MRLLTVKVQHWRGLEDVAMGPLSPHLNLITGPNRSGKTRLQQAIWFAMMESSKGNAAHKSKLQSRLSHESPRVTVEFESGGVDYELSKQFLRNSFTRLAGGGKTLEGLEAESQLRAILGTKPGGRSVDIADSGIWPLLWVEQGKAGNVPHESINEDARNALHGRLAREVGAATIGKIGTDLMTAAELQYQRHYTATGQERIELRLARTTAHEAQQSFDEAVSKHEAVGSLAEEVRKLQESVASFAPRIEAQDRALQEALARAKAAEQSKSALAIANAQAQQLDAERVQATDIVKRRAELEDQIVRAEAAHARAERNCATCGAVVDKLTPKYAEIDANVIAAESERDKANTTLVHVTGAAHKAALKREIAGKSELLEAIQSVATKADAQTKLKASLAKFADKSIKELRQRQELASRFQAELKGAAVSLTITAKKDVAISGKAWSKGDSSTFSIASDTNISIGDVAELKVQPGGADLAERRDQARDAAGEVRDRLTELGVESLAEAEQKNKDLRIATQALEQLQERLDEMAPDGVDAIKTDLAGLRGAYQGIDVPDQLPTETQAKKAAGSAVQNCDKVRAERSDLQQRLSQAREDRASADQALRAIVESISALKKQLNTLPSADDIKQKAAEVQHRWEEGVAVRNAAKRAYDESGGEAAKLENIRASKALENLERDLRKAEQLLHTRGGELQRAESEGLYELRQNAEGNLVHSCTVLERKLREAAAAKTLWGALAAKRGAMQERMIKPIITRVSAYLEPLFPGCRLDMTDSFEIRGVVEGSMQDEFADLSGGEREQLSLVVRLALADVLRGDGTLPLLFDDSMVNTDAERIQIVQALLYRAARNLQIILFTCQSTLFDRLGADFHYGLQPQRRARTMSERSS
jgi:DNA repair exonuclease SbcCD ATPase subunit